MTGTGHFDQSIVTRAVGCLLSVDTTEGFPVIPSDRSNLAQAIDQRAADRLVFFSDAVMAIAITLLSIDLPVPTGKTVGEFLASAADNSNEYLAFVVGFLLVSFHWRSHYRVFRYLARFDARLTALNTLWLLAIVLNPFATKLLANGASETQSIRFAIYGVLQTVTYLLFIAMLRRVKNAQLGSPIAPVELIPRTTANFAVLAAGFALSVPLFFLTGYAWILWIAASLLGGPTARRIARAA